MTLEQLGLPSLHATGAKAAGRRKPVNPTNSTNAANFSISGSHNSFIYKDFEIVILSPLAGSSVGVGDGLGFAARPRSQMLDGVTGGDTVGLSLLPAL